MYCFHENYQAFMSEQRIKDLNNIFEKIGNDYTPDYQNVLRFLKTDPQKIKVAILGQDPYYSVVDHQKVANGRSFQPATLFSWQQSFRQVSLKNIIRLIYFSYENELLSYKQIIEKDFIKITPPAWFDNLENQGVLFLNAALTTKVNHANAHQKLWLDFVQDLIVYLNQYNIIWFLWGKNAQGFSSIINNKKYLSNHPMMCNINNKDDFLNNPCFIETKTIIDWRGKTNV